MMLWLDEVAVIDKNGYRTLDDNGDPINCDARPLEDIPEDEIVKARLYLPMLRATDKINQQSESSHSGILKHAAEDYLRREHEYYKVNGGEAYISNGAMIVAMITAGYRFKKVDDQSARLYFYVVLK